MQAPADPDHKIKKLLTDKDPAKRIAGLELLDKTYRLEIIGYIRNWNRKSVVRLDSSDFPDLWEETLDSVGTNVETGKFKYEGGLRAYLRTIARCRSADFLRKIFRLRPTDFSDDQLAWSPVFKEEIMEIIRCKVRVLSESLRIVIETDIVLFFEEFKWVSLKKLTDEVNQLYFPKKPLTETAVGTRRYRGREQLRKFLRKDYFDELEDSDDLENSSAPDDAIRPEDSHGREVPEEPKDSKGET